MGQGPAAVGRCVEAGGSSQESVAAMDDQPVRERQEGATDDLPETAACLWKSGDCGCSRNGSPCGMPSPQRHATERVPAAIGGGIGLPRCFDPQPEGLK